MRCFIAINYFLVSSDVLYITKVRKKLTLQHYFQSKSINIGDIKSGRTVLLRMDYYASRGGFPQGVWDKSADLGIKNGQKHKKCDFFVIFLQKVLENEKKLLPLHSQNR